MALSRREKEDYLLLLQEADRRAQLRRVVDEREAINEKCRTLHGFIEEFWRVLEPVAEFKTGWAVQAMCAHLEAVTSGDILRLLMTVPPGMMKSLLLVFWTAWEWGPRGLPHIQVLATSYSQANVHRDNMKLRDLVKSEKFQALWPLAIREDQDAKGKFINLKSGFSEARPFSKMTGGRANRVKIDDPHDTEQAESDKERAKAVRIMRESITDRTNDPVRDAIVLIMQRLHHLDCANTAIELGYTHLNLPMEFEPGRRCRTVLRRPRGDLEGAYFVDPRADEGELLFPSRFPRPEVDALKRDKGSYAFSGQYQQRPVPREGGMFKREWFEGKIVAEAPLNIAWVRHWDLAATKRKATDTSGARTAGVKLGRTQDGRYFVGHCVAKAIDGKKVPDLIEGIAESDGKKVTIGISQDPGQAAKVQKADYITLLDGYTVRFLNEGVIGDKQQRAEPFSIQCEGGNVWLVKGPWNDEWLDEMCNFPGGNRKDIPDATSGAYARLTPKHKKAPRVAAPEVFTETHLTAAQSADVERALRRPASAFSVYDR